MEFLEAKWGPMQGHGMLFASKLIIWSAEAENAPREVVFVGDIPAQEFSS